MIIRQLPNKKMKKNCFPEKIISILLLINCLDFNQFILFLSPAGPKNLNKNQLGKYFSTKLTFLRCFMEFYFHLSFELWKLIFV